MQGTDTTDALLAARTTGALPANGARQEYLRATLDWRDGEAFVTPLAIQDSSMMSGFAAADALIVRAPHAAAAGENTRVDVLMLESP